MVLYTSAVAAFPEAFGVAFFFGDDFFLGEDFFLAGFGVVFRSSFLISRSLIFSF